MLPLAKSDCHDAPGSVDELAPRFAAKRDDVILAPEDPVQESVVPRELPIILDQVQFR